MRAVAAVAITVIGLVTWVASLRIDEAYTKGYEDGEQRMLDRIQYELHKDSRARLIQETEDLHSTPEA